MLRTTRHDLAACEQARITPVATTMKASDFMAPMTTEVGLIAHYGWVRFEQAIAQFVEWAANRAQVTASLLSGVS